MTLTIQGISASQVTSGMKSAMQQSLALTLSLNVSQISAPLISNSSSSSPSSSSSSSRRLFIESSGIDVSMSVTARATDLPASNSQLARMLSTNFTSIFVALAIKASPSAASALSGVYMPPASVVTRFLTPTASPSSHPAFQTSSAAPTATDNTAVVRASSSNFLNGPNTIIAIVFGSFFALIVIGRYFLKQREKGQKLVVGVHDFSNVELDKIEGLDDDVRVSTIVKINKDDSAHQIERPSVIVIDNNDDDDKEEKSAQSLRDLKQKPGQNPLDQRVNLFSRVSLKQQMDNIVDDDGKVYLFEDDASSAIISSSSASPLPAAASAGEREKWASEVNDFLPRLSPSKFKRPKQLLEPLKLPS